MDHLNTLYSNAVEHTKRKVWEDIDSYLGRNEPSVSFEQYLNDRKHYLEQIWINVWLNKVTNDVSKADKKAFLEEKGYVVEGVDRKIINHTFRTEMRTFQPFDVLKWLVGSLKVEEDYWEERYEKARAQFLEDQKVTRKREKEQKIISHIDMVSEELLDEHYLYFYLKVRHFTALQLRSDFQNVTKYKRVDTFALEERLEEKGLHQPQDYSTLTTFLDELTGEIHKTKHRGRPFFEYETYYYRYKGLIMDFLDQLVPETVARYHTKGTYQMFEEVYNEPLTPLIIRDLIDDDLTDLKADFLEKLQEEYIADLLPLASEPFDFVRHEELYDKALAERERRREEELAVIERKKAEEARMLEDIFAQEYRPSVGGNIRYVLHIGETNTGKTHHALKRMVEARSGLYLAPLRLLALEVYDKLNGEGVLCTLKTGEEEKVVSGSTHFSCTVEMFHEKEFFEVVVIDEAQMIADKDRGFSWYKAITKANASEVHIVGSQNLKTMILNLLGNSSIEIHEYSRDIPLQVERKPFNISQVKKGDALVCFSRKRVLETASRLQNSGFSVSMIYGSMPPETRKKQMQRFINGETTVIVSTDAIGMGLNLPIRRIVLLENEKFDGTRRRRLSSQEVKQIAGRAGRKGIYNVGKVAFTSNIKEMKHLLNKEDKPVHTFAIAPTNAVFERFQKYSRDLSTFFELWDKFDSPEGTEKATLTEERELYEMIRGTEIEARLSMMDLYGFLHLPFSTKDPGLKEQWRNTMFAIVYSKELPEPKIKKRTLEELEHSYKAIGLHLLFLYRLDKRTEASYWERIREELSDDVHEFLKTEVKKMKKKCRSCGKNLSWDHPYQICDDCHFNRYERWAWDG